MAKGKIRGFLLHLVILSILFLSLVQIIFSFHSKMFIGEFLLVLFLLLITFVSMAGKFAGSSFGQKGLTVLYGLMMINFLFIYYIDSRLAVYSTALACLGFIISLFCYSQCQDCDDDHDDIEEIEPIKEEKPVTTSFEPGKYVASKTGKKYHIPKCDWAKRIKKKRQIWFNEKTDAKKKGYQACDCVK